MLTSLRAIGSDLKQTQNSLLKTLCLAYTILASSMAKANENPTNDFENGTETTNLTVNVHKLGNAGSMESISDPKGRVIAEVYKDGNGKVVKRVECTYNTNDCPVKIVCKDAQGKTRYVSRKTYDENKVCIQEIVTTEGSITTQKYDKMGHCITEIHKSRNRRTEEEHTYNPDGKRNSTISTEYVYGEIETISKYAFDQKGRLKSIVTTDSHGKVIHIYEETYDDKDRCVSTNSKDGSGKQLETFEYAYDQNDKLVKKTRSLFCDGKLYENYEHFLDQNGDTIKVVLKDNKGKVLNSEEKVYDTNRREVKRINKDADGNIEDTIEYTYTQNGNIKTMVHKDSNGQELSSSEYTYTQNGTTTVLEKNIDGSVIRRTYGANGCLMTQTLQKPKKKISSKRMEKSPIEWGGTIIRCVD